MNLESYSVPEPIQGAVEELWDHGTVSQQVALSSAFGRLEHACRLVYEGVSASRLALGKSKSSGALRQALTNFFCWNGSPWYFGQTPAVLETSVRLHRAFTQERVERTHLVPLDRLYLENRSSSPREMVRNVRFGPNEILSLEQGELAQHVPVEALARFGPRYEFPLEDLDGFYWLLTTQFEDAGPVYRRSLFGLLGVSLSEIGSVRVFGPAYSSPIENALFVLLLILLKVPDEVPWVFSFTNDDFAGPDSSPDASALSRAIEGDSDRQFEVPDQSEPFDMGAGQQRNLRECWRQIETLLAHANSGNANFHPLTRHFFVKALTDYGVDELISNISCLEATLMLKQRNGRSKLMERFARLVGHTDARQWDLHAYDLRDGYLHSLADPATRAEWKDLARARWAVGMAVRKYVDLASRRPGTDRTSLLNSLSP